MSEFDRFADQYKDLLHDPVREYFAPGAGFFLARKIDILRDFARSSGRDTSRATWIDVGCGKGELLRAGRPLFARAVGCDISADMLLACPDVETVLQTDETRLPFEDSTADWITAVCAYHHISPRQWPAFTAEIRRVLNPGGIFAMIEHNPLNPVVQVIIRRTPVDENAVLLPAGRARRVMRGAGLQPQATRYFLCVPESLYPRLGFIERALDWAPLGGQYCVFGVNPQKHADRSASD